MNFLQRIINSLWPIESPDSPYRGKVGAAFFHPDWPWLNRLALVHDTQDDLIRSGQSLMTYQQNDERFIKALIIWEDHYKFTGQLQKAEAAIIDAQIMPVFRAYRYLRDEKSGTPDPNSVDDLNTFREALKVEKAKEANWGKDV